MSMNGDVGNSVGSAMMIGLQIGLQRQRDKAAGSWEHYAHQLERELAEANRVIEAKHTGLSASIRVSTHYEAQLRQREAELQQREAELAEQKALLAKEKNRTAAIEKENTVLKVQLSELKVYYRQQYLMARTLRSVYESLVEEINVASDASCFASLDPAKREESAAAKWRESLKSYEAPTFDQASGRIIKATYVSLPDDLAKR